MKSFIKLSAFTLLTAAVLTGCSKENDTVDTEWNGEIRLSSGITAQVRTTQDYQSNQLNANNPVGVFINEAGGNSTTYTQNLLYTANGSGSFLMPPTIYFPSSGKPVNIYAYAPRNEVFADITGSYPFSVQPDQHSQANYISSDLLWGEPMSTDGQSTKLNPVARTKSNINLSFRHLLSKVKVTIMDGAGLVTTDVQKIELMDLLPSTTLTMADGSIAAASGTKADVVMADATNIEVTEASAIAIPQTIAMGTKFMRFTLEDGGELYYALTKGLKLEGGKVYSFTITLNLTELSVVSSVTDWATGEEFNGDAGMDN